MVIPAREVKHAPVVTGLGTFLDTLTALLGSTTPSSFTDEAAAVDDPAALATVKKAMGCVHQRQAATMGTVKKVLAG